MEPRKRDNVLGDDREPLMMNNSWLQTYYPSVVNIEIDKTASFLTDFLRRVFASSLPVVFRRRLIRSLDWCFSWKQRERYSWSTTGAASLSWCKGRRTRERSPEPFTSSCCRLYFLLSFRHEFLLTHHNSCTSLCFLTNIKSIDDKTRVHLQRDPCFCCLWWSIVYSLCFSLRLFRHPSLRSRLKKKTKSLFLPQNHPFSCDFFFPVNTFSCSIERKSEEEYYESVSKGMVETGISWKLKILRLNLF